MSNYTNINCPVCESKILIDPALLLSGSRFSCSNTLCNVSVSINSTSVPTARKALTELEQLKNRTNISN